MKKSLYFVLMPLFALLALLLLLLFPAFIPGMVQFSNDGPYGVISSRVWELPQTFFGQWNDLNWLGNEDVSAPPNMTNLIRVILGVYGFAKFNAFLSSLFAGGCGAILFRVLGGNWWVCTLGALAAAFNSNNFSNACWGLGSRPLCFGGILLACAVLTTALRPRKKGERNLVFWGKLSLAGIGSGLAVMEGYDLGAILCAYVGAYSLFVAIVAPNNDGGKSSIAKRILTGVALVAAVAVVTGVTASDSLLSLRDTQVKGVGIFEAQKSAEPTLEEDPVQRWNFATQWSLPPKETLRLFIPGIFGYRMDGVESGPGKEYWGTVGETPGYVPGGYGMARFSGSGEYVGIFVLLLAAWSVAQAFRKQSAGNNIPFSQTETYAIMFWSVIAVISLLLAFGRYAPFYQAVYAMPVFGMFRNPIKYLVPFHLSILFLFGYALVGLTRAYIEPVLNTRQPVSNGKVSWGATLAKSWRALEGSEKKWTNGLLILIGVSLLGLLSFASSGNIVQAYLQKTGIQAGDQVFYSAVLEVLLYLGFLVFALFWMIILLGKKMVRKQVPTFLWILLIVVSVDFYHANYPWVRFYSAEDRLQKDYLIEQLLSKGGEDRVTVVPSQDQFSQQLRQLYSVEWLQHEFPHYNIICLESWMEPRKMMDKINYQNALSANIFRYWQLTGARHLMGVAGFAEVLNKAWFEQFDQKRDTNATLDSVFSEESYFELKPAPAPRFALSVDSSQQEVAGPYCLIDFKAALPRVALFSQWETGLAPEETLQKLNDPVFNPLECVLVMGGDVPQSKYSEKNACTPLSFKEYSSLGFKVDVKNSGAAERLLLVNDRYSEKWKAYLDGKPVDVMRCNYIARGVFVPPGEHVVEMRFEQNKLPFFVSLLMVVIGVPLVLVVLRRFTSGKNGFGEQ